MVVIGGGGCIRQRLLYLGKVVIFGQKWLYSGKRESSGKSGCDLYSGKSGCIRAKMVLFGQKWFISGKFLFGQSGFIREKVVVFGQSGSIWAKVMYLGESRVKIVVFKRLYLLYSGKVAKVGCIRAKSGCIRGCFRAKVGKKWLYFGAKVVEFGQSGGKWLYLGIRAKIVVVLGKGCCIWAKWLYLGKSG